MNTAKEGDPVIGCLVATRNLKLYLSFGGAATRQD
jgi:hypothetical protein